MNFQYAITACLNGFRLCFKDSEVRRLAIKPWLIGFVTYITIIGAAFYFIHEPAVLRIVNPPHGWWSSALYYVVSFTIGIVLFALSSMINLFLVMILSGRYQTQIATNLLLRLDYEIPEDEGLTAIAAEVGRTIWTETTKYAWLIPAFVIVGVIGFFPILTIPALVMASWLMAYEGFDVVLDVTKAGTWSRFKFAMSNGISATVFGLPFVAMAMIPFAGMLLPPILAAGATDFLVRSGAIDYFAKKKLDVAENMGSVETS
jgi:uncharacterized protein involved in cysteine biosynthesis